MSELIDNFAPALIWNVDLSARRWFHYTDRASARAIVATRTFKVGTRHALGRAGIHVCPYEPGSKAEDELASRILDGAWGERERLQAAVVLADGPDVAFESDPDTADGMRFLAPPGSEVELPNQIVGWAAVEGGAWLHSLTLFDPEKLRKLRAG